MGRFLRFSKTTFLFLAINFLVFITLSLTLEILFKFFGYEPSSEITTYLIIAVVFGMSGALISLFLSKTMAKKMMRIEILDEKAQGQRGWLVQRVYHFSRKAGLKKMPEVGIYPSPEINAFATGPSRSNSLVAVSSGLLQQMNSSGVEGVLAHEVSHIANGDMVTMALLQGVINTIAIFVGRILARMVMNFLKTDSFFIYFALVAVFEIFLTLLGSIGVYAFSRWREFRADHGGARLAGKDKMISALQALESYVEVNNLAYQQSQAHGENHKELDSFKISGRTRPSLLSKLFASHPPLHTRIRRLQRSRITS